MGRVFLSHSSKDKDFIRPIAELLGSNRCVFDEMTFEMGMKNIDEIFESMDSVDIFVYFISKSSLASEWVNKELNLAKEKLNSNSIEQIFPIIIDPDINYDNEQIAEFLKNGETSYNLRHVNNYKLAYKKIYTQMLKLEMKKNINYEESKNFFYARDMELKQFKDRFDDVLMKPIKCIVVTGIEGVGRRSYVREALKSAKVIKPYYFPSSISMKRSDSIEDLIIKISDLGFGSYTLDSLTSIIDMESKIDILATLLEEAQKCKEYIFVDDDMCLVGIDRCMPYWFEKALEKIKNNIVITIATNVKLDFSRYKKKEHIFHIQIDDLEKKQALGLLRAYSQSENIMFEREDILFLKDCLTGYPPQIIFCVDLAKENGIEYVKDNSYKLADFAESKATSILNAIIDPLDKDISFSFLAFLCNCDTVPLSLIYEIKKINTVYGEILNKFINLSICKYMGASKEYIKVNTVIQDYIQRQKIEIPIDIKQYLEGKIKEFNNNIEDSEYTDLIDFNELSLYVKENLKIGKYVPQKFLYSTIFLKTIIELYNNRKTDKVISIVKGIKEDGTMDRFDIVPQSQIQYYYCEALARKQHKDFDDEVKYFQNDKQYVNYNFLKGFNYRIQGKLEFAENSYKNVLSKNGNHSPTKRELVTIYRLLDEYETAYMIAKDNYKNDKKNIFHMQSYFDCLMRRQNLNDEEEKDVKDIMDSIEKYNGDKDKEMCYQIKASYFAYYKKKREPAIDLLNEGLEKYPGAIYLAKEIFDINEKFKNKEAMNKSLIVLENIIKDGRSAYKSILIRRRAILEAYNGKSKNAIEVELKGKDNISENFVQEILKKVDSIINKNLNKQLVNQ
ncbi:toll/interleukin-1 receptor domain-containing protein [Clostridium perfringens]|uniref:toll/interleukin-1 receptor domain-containing protein n=1 Tax=Clostridium perfringens TaxID=1502 RepID=UPI002246ED4D|nr:toll/interleukin-1 receptor domain-containing protein [Clostridium perfringens]MCX0389616.1 toll/interleukin-1 receptor domain-containing protein [Clostridium perfringens]